MKKTDNDKDPIKVGISACLLGDKVRWDAGHKRDRYISDILGEYFRFVPVCPEVEAGMGVPRESVRLVGDISSPRMVGNKTGEDWTDRMNQYIQKRTKQLERYNFSGYILKKDSPSCGMERVRVYQKSGIPLKQGRGFFGGALVDHFVNLPIEEEGRLNDPALRENFIVRVFAYSRLQHLFKGKFSRSEIVRFHTVHKYLLLAHSPKHYKILGHLVAQVKRYKPGNFKERYVEIFMQALSVKSSARKNVNVLHHIMGFLKPHLGAHARADIIKIIENYRNGLVPLIVPLTLIKHYVKLFDIEYIKDQVYLNPHPEELMLRNHV
ncbi:MAG: DUF523 and DUF1722 domain-containing protein [Candidatus Zixiibacteriota bacterium]|nr:MAG: DUF523 and DUF1722 domain-containing protein [candidate division Zixibacteria bacterium]